MSTLRVGLIGLGSMGRHHARVIRQTPGAELAAVADANGDPFGVAGALRVLPGVAELIEAGLDAAVVAVPTIYHEEVAVALASAGVPTMVEKPIAHDVRAAMRVADAFEDAKLVGVVGYVERCNPAILELRRRLQAGQLGDIYQITTSRQSPYPARISDVGVVKDLATHDLDLAAWLAGSTYDTIHAEVAYRSGRQHEDMVVAIGKMVNGIIVSHTVNWLAPFKERRTTVIGERGALVADTATGDLTHYANASVDSEWDAIATYRGPSEGDVTRYAFPKPEPLAVEQQNFLAAVRGEPNVAVSMREGVRTLEVIERVLASATLQPGTSA